MCVFLSFHYRKDSYFKGADKHCTFFMGKSEGRWDSVESEKEWRRIETFFTGFRHKKVDHPLFLVFIQCFKYNGRKNVGGEIDESYSING